MCDEFLRYLRSLCVRQVFFRIRYNPHENGPAIKRIAGPVSLQASCEADSFGGPGIAPDPGKPHAARFPSVQAYERAWRR